MRHRSERLINEIDVTGFLSVMIVLLFLFIFKDQPDVHHQPSVDLPQVSHPKLMRGANREDGVIISIQTDGRIYLGNDRIVDSELPTAIRNAIDRSGEKKVYINAAGRARYRAVLNIIEALRSIKISDVVSWYTSENIDVLLNLESHQ
jgi:biopolymer transport protein ExbD